MTTDKINTPPNFGTVVSFLWAIADLLNPYLPEL